jgi:hypothetical protein
MNIIRVTVLKEYKMGSLCSMIMINKEMVKGFGRKIWKKWANQ